MAAKTFTYEVIYSLNAECVEFSAFFFFFASEIPVSLWSNEFGAINFS